MKRTVSLLAIFGFLVLFTGCKKKESDADAIRSGINQHLASLKTLNLDAMDMDIANVSVQGNTAQALVEFKPKIGAPQGAGMQIAYTLQKQNGLWVVQNSEAVGVSGQHSVSGKNPHSNTTSPPSDSLPNFRDLVPSGGNSNALPPGHPPVNPQGNAPTQ